MLASLEDLWVSDVTSERGVLALRCAQGLMHKDDTLFLVEKCLFSRTPFEGSEVEKKKACDLH